MSRNLDINPVTGRRVTWTRVTNQPPVGHRWGAGGWKGSSTSNGAEPNCNSCYHGSSRQRGGAEWSLGRFTTLKFIQKFGGFLHGVLKITIFLFPNISSLIYFYLSPFLSLPPLPIQSWSMDCCQETLKSLFSNWQC